MTGETALLTFGIGPVHSFIAQARRVADVWAGSHLLSHLIRQAMRTARDEGGEMVFPFLERNAHIPPGVPNRFVCRVPADRASEIAEKMEQSVQSAWNEGIVKAAVWRVLRNHDLFPSPELWSEEPQPSRLRQTDALLDFAWSWVPETEGYARASLEGARQFAASRWFRPFEQAEARWEKCAICGERTALPNGIREDVRVAWEEAAAKSEGTTLARYFRFDQGRLCLVCSAKRLYTFLEGHEARFEALDRFQPSDEEPYLALVKMDGDRMGSILSLPETAVRGGLEGFHKAVSRALLDFAGGLREDKSVDLNVEALGYAPRGERPQLIYAGGDDVLFICDPRDALPLVKILRERYVKAFDEARELLVREEDRGRFTISAGILFAHSSHPAGLLLRDLEEILEVGAKARGGRDAVALSLAKRGGAPEEAVFQWSDGKAPEGGWIAALDRITEQLRQGEISSKQTFTLRLEERTLLEVFQDDPERWRLWLADRLSRNEAVTGQSESLAKIIVPFFRHDRTAALRIARFLGREAER